MFAITVPPYLYSFRSGLPIEQGDSAAAAAAAAAKAG
jgi:hypothetical protein